MTIKISFLIDNINRSSGGTSAEVVSLANRYAVKSDYSVAIICRKTSVNDMYHCHPAVKFVHIPSFASFPWLFHSYIKIIREIIASDVVFVTGIWGRFDGIAPFIAIKFFNQGRKIVFRICGMLEPYILSKRTLKKKLAILLYVRFNLNRCNSLILNSQSECNKLPRFVSASTYIIKNGLTLPLISDSTKKKARSIFNVQSNERIFLYMGRIDPKKGLDLFLRSLLSLDLNSQALHPTRFFIAGTYSSSSYKDLIESLVNQLPSIFKVEFFGQVSGNDKTSLLNASDVFFLPSFSEGMPNAILEAMSYALPILTTYDCNILEIAEYDAGILVNPNVSDLGSAFVNMNLTSLSNLRCMGERSRKFIGDAVTPKNTDLSYQSLIKTIVSS